MALMGPLISDPEEKPYEKRSVTRVGVAIFHQNGGALFLRMYNRIHNQQLQNQEFWSVVFRVTG